MITKLTRYDTPSPTTATPIPPPATRPTKKTDWIRPSTGAPPPDWTRLADVSTPTSTHAAPTPRTIIAIQGASRPSPSARISWPAPTTAAPNPSSVGGPIRCRIRDAPSAVGTPHSGGSSSSRPSVDSSKP